jgi:hypothetical protein
MTRWFEHRQVYVPNWTLEASAEDLGPTFEEVRFTTSYGVKLHSWFFPWTPIRRA